MTRKWLRWMPAAVVPAVIAAGVLSGSLPASAGDPLPEKTPQQVLLMVAQHGEKSLSGTLEQTSRSACRNFRRPARRGLPGDRLAGTADRAAHSPRLPGRAGQGPGTDHGPDGGTERGPRR